jgi:hypothetical protein
MQINNFTNLNPLGWLDFILCNSWTNFNLLNFLLNQPAKQQSTSKSEVQRKGQILESTMKNFGVNALPKRVQYHYAN